MIEKHKCADGCGKDAGWWHNKYGSLCGDCFSRRVDFDRGFKFEGSLQQRIAPLTEDDVPLPLKGKITTKDLEKRYHRAIMIFQS